jgi:lysophospholipase L1-like esterase
MTAITCAVLTLAGDWQIEVSANDLSTTVTIEKPEPVHILNETFASLPVFNPNTAPYAQGVGLAGVKAQECSVRYALHPESLIVKAAPESPAYVRGKDYDAELSWGCIGRLEGGAIPAETPVVASYAFDKMRLDTIVLTQDRSIMVRKGVAHVANPQPPELKSGETRLANIWVTPQLKKLSEENLFPVLEAAYPEPPPASPSPAERSIPRTMAKLNAGEKVRILAWGDSVTDGSYLPGRDVNRWQEQFIRRLRARYPKAEIELMTEAWGGRNTDNYRTEPPGSVHNYQEKVLALKPDLIISEFVNDAWMDEASLPPRYNRIRDEFQSMGTEWILITPHYVRTDWMGLTTEKGIDEDPRPYVKALRKFAAENNLAVAEGSLRYGRLWRQGIPYSTLMMNNINHPNPFGMVLFADALMQLFPQH